MPRERHTLAWLALLSAIALGLWLLRAILLPFVLGMAIGFLLDPLVSRLERRGLSRQAAASMLVLGSYALGVLGLVLLAPVLVDQAAQLATRFPAWLAAAADSVRLVATRLRRFSAAPADLGLAAPIEGAMRRVGDMAGDLLGQLVTQGWALANLAGLLAITPLVAFYLLRDWPRIVAAVDDALPRAHAPTIRALARECDELLAASIRGQAIVCVALSGFYAVALSLLGLQSGLVIGLAAGALSFVPYVGTALGLVVSVGQAVAQAWPHLGLPVLAFAVFAVGQVVSDYVLTPRVVGDRARLHPLWVIFAVFAGGTLFGVVGLVIAVPASAAVGVLVRFGLRTYKRSALYDDGATP